MAYSKAASVVEHRWSAAHREGCEYAHCARCNECETTGVRMVPQGPGWLCPECDATDLAAAAERAQSLLEAGVLPW